MDAKIWANSSCIVSNPNADFSMIENAASCELDRSMFDGCRNVCFTKFYPFQFNNDVTVSPLIYGIIFPILVSICVLANIFVVLVLGQKHMVSPTNLVLLYMAIADVAVGVVPFPFTLWFFTFENYKNPANLRLWSCYMFQYLMDALPPICHNIAMWLTVILALQRFVYIQYPVQSQTLCNVRNVRIAATVIVIVSFLCGTPKIFDRELAFFDGWRLKLKYQSLNKTLDSVWIWETNCIARLSPIVLTIGLNSFYNLYFWTRAILFIMIPSVLLIILNGLLIRGIRKANQRKARLLQQNRRREARRQTESNTTSIMLVIIVSVFLVVNLPQGFFLAFLCVDTTFNLKIVPLLAGFLNWFLPVDNMLIIATYPLNFAIYCFMSSQFRDTFKRLFLRNLPPRYTPRASRSSLVQEDYTLMTRISTRWRAKSTKPKRSRSTMSPENGTKTPSPVLDSLNKIQFEPESVLSNQQQTFEEGQQVTSSDSLIAHQGADGTVPLIGCRNRTFQEVSFIEEEDENVTIFL